MTARWTHWRPDRLDLGVVAVLYLALIGVFRIAFGVLGTEREIPLFLVFAVAGLLVLGVAVPVVYTVWTRHRSLEDIGVGAHRRRESLALGFVLGGIQFALTLAGYQLPGLEDWVPLLVMSLVVGLFEAIFFRGFVQGRLEASFGILPGIVGAAGLYALYHVGYGMAAGEIAFLFGLGIAYASIFRLTRNILVLWPFLTPVGAFYNNLESGDIELPWLSIVGFAEVLLAMGVVLWIARRHVRKPEPIAWKERQLVHV